MKRIMMPDITFTKNAEKRSNNLAVIKVGEIRAQSPALKHHETIIFVGVFIIMIFF